MPTSTDNQDFGEKEALDKDNKATGTQTATGPAMGNLPLSNKNETVTPAPSTQNANENDFTSDNQKGKKVDGDPSLESDQPIKE